MKQKRFNLYWIDMKYIRELAHIDDNLMSVSPQVGKASRPFIGVIVICGEQQYFNAALEQLAASSEQSDGAFFFDKKCKKIHFFELF